MHNLKLDHHQYIKSVYMTLIRHFLFCQTLFLTSSDLNFCQLSYNRSNTPVQEHAFFLHKEHMYLEPTIII